MQVQEQTVSQGSIIFTGAMMMFSLVLVGAMIVAAAKMSGMPVVW
jgi:hypothetical protein